MKKKKKNKTKTKQRRLKEETKTYITTKKRKISSKNNPKTSKSSQLKAFDVCIDILDVYIVM
uniref:Uncharacterized protein n=1 Tax=Physcomitrium patens TaxID=3218 RepID=A0A2K1KEX3_PHYPA|nr:hypothetical protein PHYPA_008705 [Physcomitrium patens]